jgi:hypothetical protein
MTGPHIDACCVLMATADSPVDVPLEKTRALEATPGGSKHATTCSSLLHGRSEPNMAHHAQRDYHLHAIARTDSVL